MVGYGGSLDLNHIRSNNFISNMGTPLFSVRRISPTTKFGSGSIPSNSRFFHTCRQVLEYVDSIACWPKIIGYYKKSINLPLMILYTWVGGRHMIHRFKTIKIRCWGLSKLKYDGWTILCFNNLLVYKGWCVVIIDVNTINSK